MKTLKIVLASLAIPSLFAAGAYAGGDCGSCDKSKEKKETSAFEVNCGKKDDSEKKEAAFFDLNCSKDSDEKKEA